VAEKREMRPHKRTTRLQFWLGYVLVAAIAVGSVHKANPHTYGVSFFSSRGPTADGRRKPDLVAPGERVDVLIDASELGVWAFHCHILPHAESEHGMFGMVTALIVEKRGVA